MFDNYSDVDISNENNNNKTTYEQDYFKPNISNLFNILNNPYSDCENESNIVIKSSNYYYYLITYIIFIFGFTTNLIIVIHFYKYINCKSTNRSYIIAIAISDIVHMLIEISSTVVQARYVNYDILCQINNYVASSTKNLCAILLFICLINNIIRLQHGSYTIGVNHWIGQACSKSSVIFTIIIVFALSYYNLWNKKVRVDPVQGVNETKRCCMLDGHFDYDFSFHLDTGILLTIYSFVMILSIVLVYIYCTKKNKLRCHANRDRTTENDMVKSVICIGVIASLLQITYLILLYKEFYLKRSYFLNLLESMNNKMMSIDEITQDQIAELTNESATTTYEALLSLCTSSFKILIFVLCMTQLRQKLCKLLRINCKLNPSVLYQYTRYQQKNQQQPEQQQQQQQASDQTTKFVNDTTNTTNNEIKLCSFKMTKFKNGSI